MRTKALLLTAALSAAGVATSMAQAVYSVNAVGYVNTVLKPGFNLISNPLTATDNTIATLFKSTPIGTAVYKYNGTGFDISTYDQDDLVFEPNGDKTVVPGEGVFVKIPGTADVVVTFVGEVSAGTLSNPLPKGLSIRSSQVPQAGTASDLGLVGEANDVLYQYVNPTGYKISTFDPDDLAWAPALGSLKVGEAFFLKKINAGTWNRTFVPLFCQLVFICGLVRLDEIVSQSSPHLYSVHQVFNF